MGISDESEQAIRTRVKDAVEAAVDNDPDKFDGVDPDDVIEQIIDEHWGISLKPIGYELDATLNDVNDVVTNNIDDVVKEIRDEQENEDGCEVHDDDPGNPARMQWDDVEG